MCHAHARRTGYRYILYWINVDFGGKLSERLVNT